MEIHPLDELRRAHRQATFIGMAMISSLIIYVIIVEFMEIDIKGMAAPVIVEILRFLFFGLAFVEFFVIRFLRKQLLSSKGVTASSSNQKSVFSPMVQKLFSLAIIIYALCESVAIYGLILFLIGGSRFDFYTFLILSLIYFVIYFPRYTQWEEWLKTVDESSGTHSI